MSTEMKFRAYHPDWNEMVYNTNWNFRKREFTPFEFMVGFSDYPQDEQWKVMRHIGRKDINGQDIYENDIVDWDSGRGEVFYRDDEARFLHTWEEKMNPGTHRPSKAFWDRVKVIGNTYEDPELLEIE